MVNLGFCRTCFSAGRGRVDGARMHKGEAMCLNCLEAAGMEVLKPPMPVAKAAVPVRGLVAKVPSMTLPARVQAPAKAAETPVTKAVVSEQRQTVVAKPAGSDRMCTRGCGKPTHRGHCAGQGGRNYGAAVTRALVAGAVTLQDGVLEHALPQAIELEAPKVKVLEEVKMDKLVAEYVRAEDVPVEAAPLRKPIGRMGELWLKLQHAPAGMRVKVKNSDVAHAGYTSRQLRAKAEKRGRAVVIQRHGTDLYCWFAEGAA